VLGRAAAKTIPCKERVLVSIFWRQCKVGGDPNVTFEPHTNHLSTLYEVRLNPTKPPPPPYEPLNNPWTSMVFFLPCPELSQKGLGVSAKGWPLWYGHGRAEKRHLWKEDMMMLYMGNVPQFLSQFLSPRVAEATGRQKQKCTCVVTSRACPSLNFPPAQFHPLKLMFSSNEKVAMGDGGLP
jgi:hypothetical protein